MFETGVGHAFSVFVYEFTCARPSEGGALAAEGWAMLSAVLDDFRRVRGVRPLTVLHETFPHVPAGVEVRRVHGEGREVDVFRELARRTDATLVIAPEFDGLLAERCRWVEEEGRLLLGPTAAAARLAGDKLLLGRLLAARGVPTPACVTVEAAGGLAALGEPPFVLKPRDGAGAQATFLVRSEAELASAIGEARREGWRGELIAQPFVPGTAASAAFLLGPGVEAPLPPAAQHLSEGRFRYLGGALPLPPDLAARASALALRAVRATPGLAGYVGVDLVLGAAGDAVIEINPRLTTSYVGLRALALDNLAEAMLRAARGEAVRLRWRPGRVAFAADGSTRPA